MTQMYMHDILADAVHKHRLYIIQTVYGSRCLNEQTTVQQRISEWQNTYKKLTLVGESEKKI